jgi:PAS domain S-box-containing protein
MKTLLLVEDEALIALNETRMLRDQGYVVVVASSGEEAVRAVLAAPGTIDLILMDVNLGRGMDGPQAAQEILKAHDIPIIFLSSHTAPDVVEKTEKITSYGYVVKNTGITVLVASIKMAFKLHASHRTIQHTNQKLEQEIVERRRVEAVLRESEERLRRIFEDGPQGAALIEDITERKNAEARLRLSEERLQIATLAASIGVWDWDVVRNDLYWDASMYRLYGVREEDFGGAYEAWTRCIHPDDIARVEAEIQAGLRGEKEYAAEFRILWPDGTIRFIQAASQTFRDDHGQPRRMIGTNLDTTGLKQAEAALQARTADLHERVKELNCLTALSALIETHGERVEALLQEVPRLLPPAMQYPAQACARITVDGQVFKTDDYQPSPWSLVCELRVQGRQVGAVEVGYLVEKPASDDAPFLVKERTFLNEERPFLQEERRLLQSIAERLGRVIENSRAEDALRASEALHRTVLQTAMDGFWLANLQGDLLEVNDAYCQMSGYSQPELLAMRISDVDASESANYVLAHVQKTMAQGQIRFETRHRRKDGSTYPVEVSAQYKPENGGRLVVFVMDITARKQVEDQFRDLHKELQHRAKNSFALISSLIDLMDGPHRTPETREALADIGARVRALAELYGLFYTTGTSSSVALDRYCTTIAASCAASCPYPGHIQLSESYEPMIIPAATAAPVGMILTELLTNACKHAFTNKDGFQARQNGTLAIRLAQRAGLVVLRVEDDGVGFPTGLNIAAGSTLGLRIVQALAAQIHGSFRIEHNAQAGQGAVCVVEFPLAPG